MVLVLVLMAVVINGLASSSWSTRFSFQSFVHRKLPRLDYAFVRNFFLELHLFKISLLFWTIYVLILEIDASGLNMSVLKTQICSTPIVPGKKNLAYMYLKIDAA
jgi:hypothetical protein